MKRAGAAAKQGSKPVGNNKSRIYALAEPMPNGMIVEDATRKRWRIGKSVGVGGFGAIYLVSDDVTKNVTEKSAHYVMKIEPHSNGPLFVELAFYCRNAKREQIEKWISDRKIDSLGMPCYISHGSHEHNSQLYRFLILNRYGQDLQHVIEAKPGKRLTCRSAQAIALKVIDILEYIHSTGYTHADIKASNLLLGLGKKEQVYLMDYGLATKYRDPETKLHFPYGPDLRQAHNGTVEYASRDAHIGAFGRRGDLEVLGYNMMEWLCGKLPWSNTDPATVVHKQKVAFMSNIQLKKIYTPDIQGLDLLERYLRYVAGLNFEEEPNYNYCRELLRKDLPNKLSSLYLDDTVESLKKKRSPSKAANRVASPVDEVDVVRKKIKVPDDESVQKRATRTTKKVTKNFNWTNVLSSNPERIIRLASQAQSNGSNSPPEKSTPPQIPGTPTPAMLEILAKKKENVCHSLLPMSPKAHHSPVRHPPSLLHEGTAKLTPAMQEVLMNCKPSTKKKIRKSLSLISLDELHKPSNAASVLSPQFVTKHTNTLQTPTIPKVPIFKPYVKPKPASPSPSTSSIPSFPKTKPFAYGFDEEEPCSSRQLRYNRRNQLSPP